MVASFEWRDGAKLKANEAHTQCPRKVMLTSIQATLDNRLHDASIFYLTPLGLGDQCAARFRRRYDVDTEAFAYSPYVISFKQ